MRQYRETKRQVKSYLIQKSKKRKNNLIATIDSAHAQVTRIQRTDITLSPVVRLRAAQSSSRMQTVTRSIELSHLLKFF